jgi:putative membrane-bound dehydrogenase-like protein
MRWLAWAALLAAQSSPNDEFELADGLEISLWAETPDLYNPTNIDIDRHGRVWVAEGVNYRRKHESPAYLQRPGGDRIVILEDTDLDGRCDRSTVFAQNKDLLVPLGVGVMGEQVLVSCSPNVYLFDKPREGNVFLRGFGGRDHDHGVHAVVAGPDGRWYFNCGNAGLNVVDKGGRSVRAGSLHGGARRKSDDGRLWIGGVALRVEPDGSGLTVLAHNFRNSYEVALDSFGDLWQSDNDDDGNQSCRMTWVMEGANYGFCSSDGARSWSTDRRPDQPIPAAHWRRDDPGVAPTPAVTGQGAPTGVVVYEGSLIPGLRGRILAADSGRGEIWLYTPDLDGAGFKLDKKIFMASRGERKRWFRPSDVAVAPDGSIFVADWHDPVVGGHDMKDQKGLGRIFRIAPRGHKPTVPKIDSSLDAFLSPAVNVRYLAWTKPPTAGELRRFSGGEDPILRARSLWFLARSEPARVVEALDDPDPRIRITAFRALRRTDDHPLQRAAKLVRDPSPAVRREAALFLRDVSWPECREQLLELSRGYDGKDRWYLEAFGLACEGKEEAVFTELAGQDPLRWSESQADLMWRLHPAASVSAWVARARSPLPLEARRQAIDALAFIRLPEAASAVADLALEGPEDLRGYAMYWARARSRNEWKSFGISDRIQAGSSTLGEARLKELKDLVANPQADGKAREKAARALALDRHGGLYLIELASEKKLPEDLKAPIAEEIYRNPDLGVRALASGHFKRPGGVELPSLHDLAKLKGSADRGRPIFFGPAGSCSKCHAFDGEGAKIGPDLTGIRSKFGRAELLDAILNPSASIAFGYETWILSTASREVYSGFIVEDGETVVLKEVSGETRSLPAREVVSRRRSRLSLMPDNAALGLSARELADLAEFLLSALRSIDY